MHAVLGLVEGGVGAGLEDVVGDFQAVHAGLVVDVLAHGGGPVVEGGQAVEELHVGVGGGFHQGGVDLVGAQQGDAGVPDLFGLAHGDPHVGVQEVGSAHAGGGVVGDGDAGSAGLGQLVGLGDDLGRRLQLGRSHHAHVHAHQGAGDEQGVGHVVAGVAQVGQGDLVQGAAGVLDHGQLVGEHLGGVPLVGQAVPHRHARQVGQGLDVLLLLAAELDAVVEAAQHPGGVGHRFLVAQLGAGGVQVGHPGSLVVGGDLEGAARARGGLLEDQRDIASLQALHLAARFLVGFQPRRQIQQGLPLPGTEVQLPQETTTQQRHAHEELLENQ